MTGWRQDGCFSLVGEIARGMLLHIIDGQFVTPQTFFFASKVSCLHILVFGILNLCKSAPSLAVTVFH